MRVPISLMIITCLLVLFFGIFAAQPSNSEPAILENYPPVCDATDVYADALPQTLFNVEEIPAEKPEVLFPKDGDVKLIGRLTRGVKKIAKKKGGGNWWYCGRIVQPEKEDDLALEWAYRIAYLAWEYTDRGSDNGITINPWGIFGVISNETGFDKCALGPWPRKWAYANGTMKQRGRCLSHTYADIKKTMTHPRGIERWKTAGIDAAPLHQLWRCNEKGMCKPKFNSRDPLPPITLDEVFSLGKGFEYGVRKMKKDSIDFKTDRPWMYWPGYRSERYDKKVVRWARMGGATEEEI